MKSSPTNSRINPGADSDAELIRRYGAGDQAAFETLVARHLSAVYSFVARYVGSPDEAEDIVADVFVKVWKHLDRFDPAKNFRTWVFTIAKNTALDWIKKKKPLVFSDIGAVDEEGGRFDFEETLPDTQVSAEERLTVETDQALLSGYIAELHPQYRAILLLRLDSQMTFREIAETLGKPLNTVKSHYRRALSLLRQSLSSDPAKPSHQSAHQK